MPGLLEPGNSRIHGNGAFATRRLHEEAVISVVKGRLANGPDGHGNGLALGDGFFLLPCGAVTDLVNHSCAPNARVRRSGEGLELVATRDIEAGEEVTTDYSRTSPQGWEMECNCGEGRCVGVVRGVVPSALRAWISRSCRFSAC